MQNHPEPGEDAAQIVTDRAEDGVEGVAVTALQIAAAEMAVALHVSNHGLDGGAALELELDDSDDTPLLTRDEDAAWIWRIVTAVSLIDIGALDLAPGDPLRLLDRGTQGVAVVGVARQRLGIAARTGPLVCGGLWSRSSHTPSSDSP